LLEAAEVLPIKPQEILLEELAAEAKEQCVIQGLLAPLLELPTRVLEVAVVEQVRLNQLPHRADQE
jgi:hypothetical protein